MAFLGLGSLNAQCDFTLELLDSWGDGWNGAQEVTVSVAGASTPYSLASGASSVHTITANTGDIIELSFNGPHTSGWPDYNSEVSFTLSDPNGALLFDSGTDPQPGVAHTETAACPSCNVPTALSASNITSNSADLTWTAGGTETAWNLEYGPAGFSQGAGTPVSSTSPSYSLTVLTSNTAYDIYAQADCGSGVTSAWVGPISFSTAVAPGTCGIFTVELIDAFGDGWNGNGLEVVINGTPIDTLGMVTGASASYDIPVDIGDIMDLNYLNTGTWGGENGWNVTDDNGTVLVSVAPTGNSGSSGAGPANTVGLAACPACSTPSALNATNVTSSSADLGWTSNGTETVWNVQYDTAGFAPGSGTIVSVTTNPYSLTGLLEGTSYDFWVQADCGSDSSAYQGPFTFTTPCAVKIAPYSEDFSGGVLPECWSQSEIAGSGWVFTGTPGYDAANNGRPAGSYAWIDFSQTDSATVLNVPDVDISGLTFPRLKFDFFMDYKIVLNSAGLAPGDYEKNVMLVEYYDANGNWTILDSVSSSETSWITYEYDLSTLSLSGTIVSVRFRGESGGSQYDFYGDILLDKVSIKDATIHDLAIVAAIAPSGCELTNSESIEVWVVNNGLVDETGFDVSYGVNGGALTIENITSTLAVGDTLMHVFAGTADMSANYTAFDVALNVNLSTDEDSTNDDLSVTGKNFNTPVAPSVTVDSVCNGDTAHVMAMSSEGDITWYDAMSGGNVVGEGKDLHVAPSATTTYYAEVKNGEGFMDDFESYTMGDSIALVNPTNWQTWPNGTPGGQYDAPIADAQAASGSYSLHLDGNAANVPDPVFKFNGFQYQTWVNGSFEFSMNMFVVTEAYFNLQGKATPGQVWALDMEFSGAGGITSPFQFTLGDSLSGSYPGTNQWFNVMLKTDDITTGTWELFIDSVSQGTVTYASAISVGGCNLYPPSNATTTGVADNYYVDDISWKAEAADACTSLRTGSEVVVNDCSNISELEFQNLSIYPNPSNGQFTITNSKKITEVNVLDLQGKVVYNNASINAINASIVLSDIESGMYTVNVKTANGSINKTITVQ